MSQDQAFNRDFTDLDAARLVQFAPIANDPQHRYYTCGWTTDQGICSSLVRGPEFSDHLRSHHGVVGPDQTKLVCCWVNCFSEMKKESLTRHVNEKHLEFRFTCPSCFEQFTRPYTMQNHISKKHPSN